MKSLIKAFGSTKKKKGKKGYADLSEYQEYNAVEIAEEEKRK